MAGKNSENLGALGDWEMKQCLSGRRLPRVRSGRTVGTWCQMLDLELHVAMVCDNSKIL